MKLQFILLAVFLSLVIVDALAEKPRKLKKVRRHHTTTSTTTESEAEVSASEEEEEKDVYAMMEKDEAEEEKEEKAAEETKEEKDDEEMLRDEPMENNEVIIKDPCAEKHCGAGQVCNIDDDGNAECICIPNCPSEMDDRRKVCSNHNETWGSDCEVYQMRCWCNHAMESCRGDKYKHVHIEYYGKCREMPECTKEEMADFPRRMREWLFNIMRDLADRQELSDYYLKMEREAETNMTRRWTNAAIWKWCDLDGHPHDRSVSRHELFPIRAPLVALEHCIAPFLDGCDEDDNHRISLKEWGKCLELDQDELNERCEDLFEG